MECIVSLFPGVFKPAYLRECEQGTNSNFKFDSKTASSWLTFHRENSVCSFNSFGADTGTGEPYPSGGMHALECVMGDKVISRGRFYWEVVVSHADEFSVGVAYKEVFKFLLFGYIWNKFWNAFWKNYSYFHSYRKNKVFDTKTELMALCFCKRPIQRVFQVVFQFYKIL